MTERDMMALPDGMTCNDCVHLKRCLGIGYTSSPENTRCDFHPIRFAYSWKKKADGLETENRQLREELAARKTAQEEVGIDHVEAIRERDEWEKLACEIYREQRAENTRLDAENAEFKDEVGRLNTLHGELFDLADAVSDVLWGGERGWERVGVPETIKRLRERVKGE